MEPIEVEDCGDFIYFTARGTLGASDILSIAAKYYPQLENRHKLWDLTQADMSALNPESFATVAQGVSKVQSKEAFPKTALVATDIGAYTLLCRYILIAVQNRVQAEYRVFRDVEQAEKWLKQR